MNLFDFTLAHDSSFLVHLEVVALDNRRQQNLILKMVADWALVMWEALLAVYTDLNSNTNYFVQLVAVVDALLMWLACDRVSHCDTVPVEHTIPCMTMHTNNERFHSLLSIVELVDYPMNFHWSMVSVVVR